jgi:hypothetical protein
MAMPFIRIPVSEGVMMHLPIKQLEELFLTNEVVHTVMQTEESHGIVEQGASSSGLSANIYVWVYIIGAVISFSFFIFSIVHVLRIISSANRVLYRGRRVLVSPLKVSSFSFAGWIVLSEMDYERFATEIIAHEEIHLRKGHFGDLCLIGIVCIIHWFNPFTWLVKREIKNLHEYETDRSVISQGINATQYQLLLIEKAAGASRYSVASSFAQSKIKKRIKMMNKQNTRTWARWRALLFIPLAALLLQAFARPEIKRELEQISMFKVTENTQEKTNWTEEKFLEELRKSLPVDISKSLGHEETWNSVVRAYKLAYGGKMDKSIGMYIAMNKSGDILKDGKRTSMEELPAFILSALVAEKERNFFNEIARINIGGEDFEVIVKYIIIESDENVLPEKYSQLLNAVGNVYQNKRNEMSLRHFQKEYIALNTDDRNMIDRLLPVIVDCRKKAVKSDASTVNVTSSSKDPSKKYGTFGTYRSEETGKTVNFEYNTNFSTDENSGIVESEMKKINNYEIMYNGKPVLFKDLQLPDYMENALIYLAKVGSPDYKMSIMLAKKFEDNGYNFILNGKKWNPNKSIDISDISSIVTYAPDEAIKQYGDKARNGAMVIKTKE